MGAPKLNNLDLKAKPKHFLSFISSNYKAEKTCQEFNKLPELQLKQTLRMPHIQALKVFIKLYGDKLNKFLSNDNINYYIDKKHHPEALTVEHGLLYFAKCSMVGKRTIERYIDRLEWAGLIIKEHTYAQVKLYINPIVLDFFPEHTQELEVIKEKLGKIFSQKAAEMQKNLKSENQQLNKNKTTSWRIMYISRYLNNKINTNVDKIKCSPKLEDNLNNSQPLQTNTNYYQDTQSDNGKKTKIKALLSRAERNKLESIKKAEHRQKQIQQKAEQLWKWTYEHLYQPQIGKNILYISESQEQYAVDFLKSELNPVPTYELNKKVNQLQKRLKLWRNFYYQPNIDGFTPLPSTFFNPNNQKGFKITLFWLFKNAQKVEYNTVKNKLSTFIRKIKQTYNSTIAMQARISVLQTMEHRKKGVLWKSKQSKLLNNQALNELEEFYSSMVNNIINQNL